MYMTVVKGAKMMPNSGHNQAPRQTTSHRALKIQARMSITRGATAILKARIQP